MKWKKKFDDISTVRSKNCDILCWCQREKSNYDKNKFLPLSLVRKKNLRLIFEKCLRDLFLFSLKRL